MGFTGAAAAALQKYHVPYKLTLELKTNFAESSTWQEADYVKGSLHISKRRGRCATLSARLVNAAFALSVERSKTNRCQLFAHARVLATLGAESEYVFQGRLDAVTPQDYSLSITARDWRCLIDECECDIALTPSEVEVVADDAYRQLVELDSEDLPGVYGLAVIPGGGDEGFDEATQTVRRSWAPTYVRLYYDVLGEEEVSSKHFSIEWHTGAVQILEDRETKTYYVSNVRAYQESAATGATNVDYAGLFKLAVKYSAADGGMGLSDGDIDMPATGIDLAGAYRFDGRVADLLADVQKFVQGNIELRYDSRAGKLVLELVTQKAAGSEDYTLYHAVSIGQPRSVRDIATRVVARGYECQPLNALTLLTPGVDLIDLASGESGYPQWFQWTQDNGGPDVGDPYDAIPLLYDGFLHKGAGVEFTGVEAYGTWKGFVEADFNAILEGGSQHIDRVRLRMPLSVNPNQVTEEINGVYFWPGINILVSDDDVTYLPLAPALNRMRYRPGTELDLPKDELLRTSARYVRVECSPYKQSFDQQNKPCIGQMELEFYLDELYEEAVVIQGATPGLFLRYSDCRALAVTAVNQGNKTFTIDGDHTGYFSLGRVFAASGSTGNDGLYTTVSSTLSAGDTVITVEEAIPSPAADGDVLDHVWGTYHPDLVTRLGSHHITYAKNWGSTLPRALARDWAIQTLSESVRLFDSATYAAICEPRVDEGDTVLVYDVLNGDVGGILVEGVDIYETRVELAGTNYRAEALSNE